MLGRVSVIAHNMHFKKKLAVIPWKNSLFSLQFSTLR